MVNGCRGVAGKVWSMGGKEHSREGVANGCRGIGGKVWSMGGRNIAGKVWSMGGTKFFNHEIYIP